MELILQQSLPHQQKAIDAVCNTLDGVMITPPVQFFENPQIDLTDGKLSANLRTLQNAVSAEYRTSAPISSYLNLDIKMETGTGKTYVYTKTIYELHKRYGFYKFIIAVPSLPIKASTAQFIRDNYARRHFTDSCGYGTEIELGVLETPKNKKKGRSYFPDVVSDFVKGSCQNAKKIYVLLVNMQLLTNNSRRDGRDTGLLWRDDYDNGVEDFYRPLNALWATKPVVVIDEPHRFSRDQKAFQVIMNEIKPQCVIRYGATFEKAKSSWLTTKYVPELNAFGNIEQAVSLLLGEINQREKQSKTFKKIYKLCEDYQTAVKAFLAVCGDYPELTKILAETADSLDVMANECSKIISWYSEETPIDGDIDNFTFNQDFNSIADSINKSRDSMLHHFHASDVTKVLRKLGNFDFYILIKDLERSRYKESLLFLGTPGTGKTHGLSALTEKLLTDGLHIPLLIQARNIPVSSTWKDIVSSNLGLSSSWNEDEIWQALISLANRHYFQEPQLSSKIKISPKVVIFVDGLDESSTHERWVERIQETVAITSSYPQIRFCFTARPTFFKGRIDYAKVERLSNLGDVPTNMLFNSYMRAYNITTQNNGWLKYALTTPLALKLFCELHQGQTVSLSSRTEVSMTALWRKKIEKIEAEYCEKVGCPVKNQYVLRAIVLLSKQFIGSERLEHSSLVDKIAVELKMATAYAESLISYLENYGILSCYCEHGTGLSPDIYFYYPGIQGYFDYASALHIISQYEHPKDIDFGDYKAIQTNTLNSLAIISIQKYGYLLTRNPTCDAVIDGC